MWESARTPWGYGDSDNHASLDCKISLVGHAAAGLWAAGLGTTRCADRRALHAPSARGIGCRAADAALDALPPCYGGERVSRFRIGKFRFACLPGSFPSVSRLLLHPELRLLPQPEDLGVGLSSYESCFCRPYPRRAGIVHRAHVARDRLLCRPRFGSRPSLRLVPAPSS
jgi:hypothetical protein